MLNKVVLSIAILLTIKLNLYAEEIRVLGAASLKYVLEDIKNDFLKDRTKDKIEISYMSSGKAYAQIANGAPVDLFVSADTKYPARLFENKLAPQKEEIYANGKLVLWSNNEKFKITKIEDILDSNIQHIAIPNPKVAPYGKASIEALRSKKLLDKIQDKLVQGESIGAATTYVETKNADIGFTALSMLGENGINSQTMSFITIEESLYEPISQALILTNKGEKSKLAQEFKEYILGPNAKIKFKKFGYSVE